MTKVNYRSITPEVRKGEDGSRKMTFVASDGTRDSMGTVLNVDGWDLERFNANGIIGYQHKVYGSYEGTENPDNVIGKGYAYIQDRKLMVDVEFEPADINPLAEKVYKKLMFGSLKGVSVGFLPVGKGAWGKGEEAIGGEKETYYYKGQELLEVSVVNIPANPKALKRGLDQEELDALRAEAEEILEEEEVLIDAEQEADEPMPEEVAVEEPVAEEPAEERSIDAVKRQVEREILIARAALLNS